MNRRDFFKFAFAVAAAAHLPAVAAPATELPGEFISLDAMRRAADILKRNAVPAINGSYIVCLHPDAAEDLMAITDARTAWKQAYRAARVELKRMARSFMESTEVGSVENVRFIVSENILNL